MSEELRPCSFCGGTKICTEKGINLNYCDNCSAESNVEHWNTRPIEDALNARIAELEAENAGLKERVAMLDVTAVFKSLGEMGYIEQTNKLHTRIAELEGLVDELIEAGESMSLAVECENQIEANAYYSWKELVKDWKERER